MNIMGGMEHAGGIKLNDHKRKLKNRFEICRRLGQGTYGKVQLGINKETGQQVRRWYLPYESFIIMKLILGGYQNHQEIKN